MIYGWSRTHSGNLSTLSVGRVIPHDKSRLVATERVSHIVLNNSTNLEFTLKLNARPGVKKIASGVPLIRLYNDLKLVIPAKAGIQV